MHRVRVRGRVINRIRKEGAKLAVLESGFPGYVFLIPDTGYIKSRQVVFFEGYISNVYRSKGRYMVRLEGLSVPPPDYYDSMSTLVDS